MTKLITFFFLLLAQTIFAQATSSKISEVTVFRQNASITRTANLQLKAGKQEIVLSNLSTYVNPASLQVMMKNKGATLLSAKYLTNYLLDTEESPAIVKLRDEMEVLQEELAWNQDQVSILKNMEEILKKNQVLGGKNTGFTAAEVTALVTAQKAKYLELKKEIRQLAQKAKKINTKRTKIQQQLNELNAVSNQPTGDIVLTIQADRAMSLAIFCSYIVSQAGWSPMYDLRSEGITNDVELFYKGNIYQQTGQDWKEVKVTVSTGNPTVNNNRPILSPLYARFVVRGVVGYRSEKKKIRARPEANMMMEEDKELEASEVVVSGFNYGAEVNTNQLTVEYDLPGKHDIFSDGKENLLALKSYELKTDYIYHTVPKLDRGAFLLAKISDWGQFNLESGQANVFFEGAYIGETYIDANVTSKELMVSMGRDNSIVVTRKRVKDFSEKKFIGTKVKETYAYEITIKNKKRTAIKIEILDQIPVATDKKISIDLEEKGSAVYTEESGKLLWTLDLAGGQSKKERFVYLVKYPKGESVSGLK